MNSFDVKLYTQFTDLKGLNPSLNVFISIGGWDAGGKVFSDMVSTPANRAAFINSLRSFMKTYAFDGVNIDWEYPVADDRGGNTADFANFVTFLSELRSALGTSYGITATLPSSYWYMQHFDIAAMEPHLDWFNMMIYDIHGTWDGANRFTSAVVQAHTNLSEIDQDMDLLWRNKIDSSKVVLGLGFYGRSFTLKDLNCNKPGCAFSGGIEHGGAKAGRCTATSGILSSAEIQDIISSKGLKPVLDKEAGVKYMSWDNDQWVSYDDEETFKMKMDYANSLCLGGTMVWALDLDTLGVDGSIDNLAGAGRFGVLGGSFLSMKVEMATTRSNSFSLGLFWTPYQLKETAKPCPIGYYPMAWAHGKVFDADLSHNTGEGCHGGGINGFRRALCAAENVYYDNLQWGPGSKSKACNSKCSTGWVTVSKNSHIWGQKKECKSGKYVPLCASGFRVRQNADTCPSNEFNQFVSGGLALRADPDGVDDFDFDDDDDRPSANSAKLSAFREVRSRRLSRKRKRSVHGDYNCGLGILPRGGIPLDIPAKVVGFVQSGRTYSSLMPTTVRISSSSRNKPTRTVHISTTTTTYSTVTRTCNGDRFPQACYHYSSVVQRMAYSRVTCANKDKSDDYRPLVKAYNDGHTNKRWFEFIAYSYKNPNNKRKALACERDESPEIRMDPRPTSTTVDVGFALQTDDPWYGGRRISAYNSDPGTKTNGVKRPNYRKAKRFGFVGGRGLMVVDEGNSTRLATNDEIETELGYTQCQSVGCKVELEILRQQQAQANMPTVASESQSTIEVVSPVILTAVPTTTTAATVIGRPTLTAYASRSTAG